MRISDWSSDVCSSDLSEGDTMQLKNSIDRWGAVSMFLHWLILALVLWMAWLGLTMTDMPNTPRKVDTYALHKSIGLAILALMLLRGAWRLHDGAPRPVARSEGRRVGQECGSTGSSRWSPSH